MDVQDPQRPALEPEEEARARWYALLSRLFHAPADPNLLAEIGNAESAEGEGDLPTAWRELQAAGRTAFPALIRQEYDTLFVGVGQAEVSPYLSGYAEPAAPDRYLVRLRERLAGWGYGRREGTFEFEDHVSGVADVMRRLIVDGQPLSVQQRFFQEFAYPGIGPFCEAVRRAPSARFYVPVAALTQAFFELEQAAFELGEVRP